MIAASIRTLIAPILGALALGLPCYSAQAAAPKRSAFLAHAHAGAVDSFRHGRFSEAYGRFIALAHWGDPDGARYALWMCENGAALFGTMWAAPRTRPRTGPAPRALPNRGCRRICEICNDTPSLANGRGDCQFRIRTACKKLRRSVSASLASEIGRA